MPEMRFNPSEGYNHRLEIAERRANAARGDARNLAAQNEKLNQTLREARSKLVTMKAEVDALSRPPLNRALVTGLVHPVDDRVAELEVSALGRLMRVSVLPDVFTAVSVGSWVLLNESSVAVAACSPLTSGELATVVEAGPGGVVIQGAAGDEVLLSPVGVLGD